MIGNLRFIRPFNDWEMEETQRLISLISSKIAQRERDNLLDSRQDRPILQYTVKVNHRNLEEGTYGTLLVGLI